MTDEFEKLEAELSALRPAPMPAELRDEIGSALKRNRADRSLLATIGAGLTAACVTIALLTTEKNGFPPAPPGPQAIHSPRWGDFSRGDFSLALARMDGDRLDGVR